jgi:hypothetical protein
MEDELDAYIEEHSQRVEDNGKGGEDFVQPSNTVEFPYVTSLTFPIFGKSKKIKI